MKHDQQLIHIGVLGMKWGVRKPRTATDGPKNIVERHRENKWTRKAMSTETYVKVHNKVADSLNNEHIQRINNKKEYRDKNFNDPKNAKLYSKYIKEYNDISVQLANEAYREIAGISPYSGNRVKVSYNEDHSQTMFELVKDSIDHSASDGNIILSATNDKNYNIISFVIDSNSNDLEHAGILGMRWGVRRRASGPVSTSVRGKSVPALTSVRGKTTPVVGGKTSIRGKVTSPQSKTKTASKKRSPEEAKKYMANQRKKKIAQLKAEQHVNDVKRTTNHLLTAYLVSTQAQRISEITAPYKTNNESKDDYASLYQNWLANG